MKKIYYIVILIPIVLMLGFYWGAGNKNNEYQDDFCIDMIHDIYKSSSAVNSYLSNVDEWAGYDIQKLNKNMSRVIIELAVLENSVDYYLDNLEYDNWENVSIIQEFSESLTLLDYIVSDGLTFNDDLISNDFMEDGVLDSEEIVFLQTTQEEFEYIVTSLDNAGRQYKEDGIGYAELRNSLERFTKRYSNENINDLKVIN